VLAKGQSVTDKDSHLPIFTSQGAATQHAAFKDQNFDLRVSFDQLANVMRIVVARKLGVSPAQVGDGDLAATWGARWNDPDAWVLLNSEVGQEVYNPLTDRTAYLGGSFKQLYVGRHPS